MEGEFLEERIQLWPCLKIYLIYFDNYITQLDMGMVIERGEKEN